MDQIKAHYDRYLLAAAGLLLAGVAVFAALNAGGLGEKFTPPEIPTTGEPFAEDEKIALLRADHGGKDKEQKWQDAGHPLFISRIYLLREGRLVDILESGAELFPGIANAWILENNLDYTDPRLPDGDPDSDGFSNIEEFRAKTNPRDPGSQPALWTKLRTVGSRTEKLRFKFTSLPKDSLTEVAINTVSAENPEEPAGATQFYPRASEVVPTAEGEKNVDKNIILLASTSDGRQIFDITPFVFSRAEKRKERNPATNTEEEIALAVLVNTEDEDGTEIILEQGADPIDSPFVVTTIQDTRSNGQTYELSAGDTFQLSDETYKLVDVKGGNAIIENSQSGEKHEVPLQAAAPEPNPPNQLSP